MVNLNKKSSGSKKGPKDFEKAKTKVGRVKSGAVNATNTSFQSRRLQLCEQQLSTQQKIEAIAKEKRLEEDSLVAQLQPYLSQCEHYSATVRKEAFRNVLSKCKELSDQVPSVASILASSIIGRGLIDGDSNVRSVAINCYGYLIERLRAQFNASFAGLVPYFLLACSHLDDGIRNDFLKILNTCLKIEPGLLSRHLDRLLGPLIDIKISLKNKDVKFRLICDLIDFYCQRQQKGQQGTNDAIMANYQWEPVQKQSLNHLRMIRRGDGNGNNNTLSSINQVDIVKLIKYISSALMDEYLDERAKKDEKKVILGGIGRIERFLLFCGYDRDFLLLNLTPKFRNVLK